MHLPPLPCAILDCAHQGHTGARPGVTESLGSPQPEMLGEARARGQKEVEGARPGADMLEGPPKEAGQRPGSWTEGAWPAVRVYFRKRGANLRPPTVTLDSGVRGESDVSLLS